MYQRTWLHLSSNPFAIDHLYQACCLTITSSTHRINGFYNVAAMPYVPPTACFNVTSSSPSFPSFPQAVLSPIYTSPSSSGHTLTSPFPVRRTKPLPIPIPLLRNRSPSTSNSTSPCFPPARFPLGYAYTDSIEILRHGKHAQSSGQPQQSSKPSKAEKQQSPTQAQLNAERKEQERQAHYHQQQQQQAQAQYNNDMGGQGLAAGMCHATASMT